MNTPFSAPETYAIPRADESVPKYLEIIYDENDDRPMPVNPYEIPLPPLVDGEHIDGSSLTSSENSNSTNSITIELSTNNTDAHNESSAKSRTISSSSTVSETSVYSQPKKKEQLNAQPEDNDLSKINLKGALPNSNEDCTTNEQLLMSQQSAHTNDISKRKLQQLYANTNIETAIRSCDGITSM